MNKQSLKKHVVFIIALIMFSAIPALVNAQKTCPDGNCPKGQVCINGVCVKSGGGGGGGGGCNCSVRPIPFHCGQICGFRPTENESLSISSATSNAISFQLVQTQNVSAKIYDATGRFVKTIADSKMSEGYYQIEWGAKDETGNAVQAGVYVLKIEADNYTGAKKILIVK